MASEAGAAAAAGGGDGDGFTPRPVDQVILSREQGGGAGARVRRSIGTPMLRTYDPFLMLDEFKVGLPAGFPDHPHRGFETVTFMLPETPGSFEHEDFKGHRGLLRGGDLQWMTAGKGVLHSEVPTGIHMKRTETGEVVEEENPAEAVAHGLQLWINLKSQHKMVDPDYQELKYENVPKTKQDGVFAAVISGSALGITSPVHTRTPVHYLYFEMDPNSTLLQPVPDTWNAFTYTLSGKAKFGADRRDIEAHHTVTFTALKDSSGIRVQTADEPCRFVILAGEPVNEPVAWHGPFVMSSNAELREAFMDFQLGRNGFEGAADWESEIGKRVGR